MCYNVMKTDKDIDVTLLSIAEESDECAYNHKAIRRYAGQEVHVGLQTTLEADFGRNVLAIVVGTVYTDRGHFLQTRLLRHVVRAEFAVGDINDTVISSADGRVQLPHHLLTMMLGTAIGAQRGMLAVRLAGTPLASQPLPLLNVASLAESLSTQAIGARTA